jgi:hypothetical protein
MGSLFTHGGSDIPIFDLSVIQPCSSSYPESFFSGDHCDNIKEFVSRDEPGFIAPTGGAFRQGFPSVLVARTLISEWMCSVQFYVYIWMTLYILYACAYASKYVVVVYAHCIDLYPD